MAAPFPLRETFYFPSISFCFFSASFYFPLRGGLREEAEESRTTAEGFPHWHCTADDSVRPSLRALIGQSPSLRNKSLKTAATLVR